LFILVLLPIISAIIIGLFGRFIGYRGVKSFSVYIIFLCNFLAVYYFIFLFQTNNLNLIKIGTWLQSNILIINWGFYFDSITCTILVVITTISSLVHLYSCDYIKNDPHIIRFLIKLSFFTFFILILVTADNFLQLFLGWEGVGFCSYLLINFWYTRIQANKAAIKAILINRIGDIGLLISICLLVFKFQTLDFNLLSLLVPYILVDSIIIFGFEFNYLNIILFFLFVGVIGKSAQIGLHTWLPDAIEGPTPVSALLHAATIVTAGVFLLIKCSFLFEYSTTILLFISFWGVLTAFFAATCALVQTDIKKIIAYSTCSQLGYIVFICGLSHYSISLFHLFNHAFFKALLFLSAGIIIHALQDNQDLRKTGLLKLFLPSLFIIITIGNLALLGFPFLAGFYSKDIILEVSFLSIFIINNNIIFWLALLTTILTAVYSIRLTYYIFLNNSINSLKLYNSIFHFYSGKIFISIFFLFICSLFIGFFTRELFINNSYFLNTSIFILPEHYLLTFSEFIPVYIKLLPFFFSCLGIFIFYIFKPIFNQSFFIIFFFKWYFDKLYNQISYYSLYFSYSYIYIYIDKGIIELFGPTGLNKYLLRLNTYLIFFYNGYIFSYICLFFISFFFFFQIIEFLI